MANATTRNPYGIVDKRRDVNSGTLAAAAAFATNTRDVTAMRARLTAINGTTFTSQRLDQMTVNDMVHAIRLNDEAASL